MGQLRPISGVNQGVVMVKVLRSDDFLKTVWK